MKLPKSAQTVGSAGDFVAGPSPTVAKPGHRVSNFFLTDLTPFLSAIPSHHARPRHPACARSPAIVLSG
jgi:hypothetical protein